MKLIIDASNLRNGGGVTHIVEVLNSIQDQKVLFKKVEIFSNTTTLAKIENRDWLTKINHPSLNKGLLDILIWRFKKFNPYLKTQKETILFNPPGTYTGSFKPFVVMSHNMLIWDKKERRRFGKFSSLNLKFKLLNKVQKKSFNKSAGIIFISNYAKNIILRQLQREKINEIIFHGINNRFIQPPKEDVSDELELLYISNIIDYKHQVTLLRAFLKLYKEGYKFKLNLVGGYHKGYKEEFDKEFNSDDDYTQFVFYHGKIKFEEIHNFYKKASAFIFASSCENMPNILIEAMSSGLPILCSNYEPMPEFLGENHPYYFDPTSKQSTYEVVKDFIASDQKLNSAKKSFEKASIYNWETCANKTFKFLYNTLEKHNNVEK